MSMHIRALPTAIMTALLQQMITRTPTAAAQAGIEGPSKAPLPRAQSERNAEGVWEDAAFWALSESQWMAQAAATELHRIYGASDEAGASVHRTDPSVEQMPAVGLLRHD